MKKKSLFLMILFLSLLCMSVYASDAIVGHVELDQHTDAFRETVEENRVVQQGAFQDRVDSLGKVLMKPVSIVTEQTNEIIDPIGELLYEEKVEQRSSELTPGPKFKFRF